MALWRTALSLQHLLRGSVVSNSKLVGTSKYGSALYIVGEKATDVCVVVNPHVEWIGDVEGIKEVINRRGAKKEWGDVEQLEDVWKFYTKLKQTKEQVEEKINEHTDKIRELYVKQDTSLQKEMDNYKAQRSVMKEDLRTLRSSLWSAEEKAVLKTLTLPNLIHPLTPDEAPNIIYTHGTKPQIANPISHIELGLKKGLLQLYSGQTYYLKDDAAIFELCSKYYFSDCLRKAGYVQFSNADIVKSVVVEGCGGNHTDSDCVFILHHNEPSKMSEDMRLHLVGGGSLCSFAAYHTRNIVPRKMLPLRYFALGRQYKPVPASSKLGLFEVAQSAVVEMFTMLDNSAENLDEELHKTVEIVTGIYKNIGHHFRVCYLPARDIHNWESLHVSFQMFSPCLNDYIEVGNISVSDDYISKRLQILYKQDKDSNAFTKIISGTLLSVPKLLGCILELNPDEFEIPKLFRQHMDC